MAIKGNLSKKYKAGTIGVSVPGSLIDKIDVVEDGLFEVKSDLGAVRHDLDEGLGEAKKGLDSHVKKPVLDHADGSVTDDKLGVRVVDDNTAYFPANSGLLSSVLSWFGKIIKAISGEDSWRNKPVITLRETWAHINNTSVHGQGSADAVASLSYLVDNLYNRLGFRLANGGWFGFGGGAAVLGGADFSEAVGDVFDCGGFSEQISYEINVDGGRI